MTAPFRSIGIRTGRLAIAGAAFRLPGCASLDDLASLLLRGGDAVTEIADTRWSKSRFFDPRPGEAGKSYTFAAGCIEGMGLFDADFFGLSPREAMQVDPHQRLLLELVQEALEDAGLPAAGLAGRDVGVYVGGSSYEFALRNAGDVAASDTFTMQGAALSSLSNRVSYTYDLRGPSLTIDTACSSAMVALHMAGAALERGEIEIAIVGGVNLLLTPQTFVGFARASMLSRKGRCHAFDARADGYVRAEGGGALILMRAQDMPETLHPRAEILATGVNSDGRTHGFSMPSARAQAALLSRLYGDGAIAPDALGYFEAHGTGTPVGDPVEAQAIGSAIGRRRGARLPVGTVKSNLGHLEAASAMAAIAKALVVLDTGRIPRSLHNETPHPGIPFDDLGIELMPSEKSLPQGGLIGINAFGFGGTNAHAVLAKPTRPLAEPDPANGGGLPPLLLSARSRQALHGLAGRWRARLADHDMPLAAALRGAARGRDHHPHRAVIWADDAEGVRQGLDALAAEAQSPGVTTGEAIGGDLAFVFSGNGAQWTGMGRDALANSPGFRTGLKEVDRVLETHLGWSAWKRLETADARAMRDTAVAQPLLFAIQAALVLALAAQNVRPAMVTGHSAGEVAAALAAGALTLDQACQVIAARSRRQQETHDTGRMAALRLPPDAIAEIAALDPRLEISAINAPGAITVAGTAEAVAGLLHHARERGWSAVPLDLDYAFHSRAMDQIRDGVLRDLAGLEPSAPRLPLISTVTGLPVAGAALDATYWWRNVRAPVLFADACQWMIANGARIFLEIGPHPVLLSYLRDLLKTAHPKGLALASLARGSTQQDAIKDIVARCHVAGVSIAGAPLFDGPRQVHGLPGTVWRRAPCDLPVTPEALPVADPLRDHPLLGYREGRDVGAWWSHLAIAHFPWLADHVVAGQAVLPAAAMIDMALAAAAALHPRAQTLEIQGLEIGHFLALDEGTRTTRFTASPDGRFTFSSFPRMDPAAVTRHATGRLWSGGPARRAPSRPSDTGDTGEIIAADTLYEIAGRLRLQYGPAFRTVRCVRVHGGNTALAELARERQRPPAEGWMVDPALLDGALQALLAFAAVTQDAQGGLVPWRFGRIVFHMRAVTPSRARLTIRRRGPRTVAADILLTDDAGRVLLELLDCWFVRHAARPAQNPASLFHEILLPAADQPPRESPAPAIPPSPPAPAAPSTTLTDAFLAQAAARALKQHDPAGRAAMALQDWLGRHGAAARLANLPDADALWRTIYYGAPDSAAETMLISALASSLTRGEYPPRPLPAPLLDQMLKASATARAAQDAILAQAASWLARAAPPVLRVAMTGHWSTDAARRLADLLASRPLRLEVFAGGAAAELSQALAGRPEAIVRPAMPEEDHGAGRFDLVLAAWAMGTLHGCQPAQLSSMLAPGGMLIAVEPANGGLAALLRLAGAWRMADAAQAASAWRAMGLDVQEPIPLAAEIWPAAILTATAPVPPPQPGPLHRPFILAAPDDPWKSALEGVITEASWRDFPEDDAPDANVPAGADVLLLVPAVSDGLVKGMARLLPRVAALCLALEQAGAARLTLVVRADADMPGAMLSALRRVSANEIRSLTIRLLHLDPAPSSSAAAAVARELAMADGEPEVAIAQSGLRLVPRLTAGLPQPEGRDAPDLRQPLRLSIEHPGAPERLAWTAFTPPPLAEDEIAIDVAAAGLNFRDVMWSLGMLPDEALLDGFSGPSLGLECAGTVRAVGAAVTDIAPGDRVAALAPAALATVAVTRRGAVVKLPRDCDFALAAGMPVAFMTAIFTLGHLARIAPGERVLIHGGAGGVGLAAIQYALHRGAIVYATAGDPARRGMLRRLGAQGAFDSRSARFRDDILAATGGEGVDVVLNSLAGELMEHSLGLLRPFGRFVEIGKRDLYMDSRIGLRALRHNASFFAADLDELARARPATAKAVLDEMQALLRQGHIRPLPVRRFAFSDAAAAFRLMQGSGHIGKIVLERDAAQAAAPEPGMRVRPDGVYVVTGGLAGFGLEAARFLAAHGAKKLALISRRGAATPGADAAMADLAAQGIAVTAHACDVSDAAALAPVWDAIRAQGPIRGLLHAAMALDDARLADQDMARFEKVLAPKLGGALALDMLSRRDPLDFFILFSSITTAIGNPGQANYVAANAGMEALARRRARAGLPALAVRFGPIGDAGYLARETRIAGMLETALGSRHLTAAEALAMLPSLLASGQAVAGVAAVQWGAPARLLPRIAAPLMDLLPKAEDPIRAGGDLRERLAALPPDDALALTMTLIGEELARILRLPAASVTPDRPIADLGLDSLMTVELAAALEARAGCRIPPLALGDQSTLRSVAASLAAALAAGETGDARASAILLRHEPAAAPPASMAESLQVPA